MSINLQGDRVSDAVVGLWAKAVLLHREMSRAYDRIGDIRRERPGDEGALMKAQAQADELGRRYERLCERIYEAEPWTLEGVLAKLRCAARCIQDTVPTGKDPERVCDIELRFVFALERDVERLVRRSMNKVAGSSKGKANELGKAL